jgi:peptidoglycan/xylan/chitin deacetylase (PgdA/CDA1 family)
MDELVDAIHSGDWSRIPQRALVVTLDDGHRDNVALLDVFRRHGVTPTIYVCTQIVRTRRRFWWTIENIDRPLLFNTANAERLRILEERHAFRQTADARNGQVQALQADDIDLMRDHVDLQAHTRFHPVLTTCSDDECAEEITRCKDEVEELTGRPCTHFSYPNGKYGARELELVERAGYRSARTIEMGFNDRDTDPLRLRIVGISDGASLNLLASQMTGIPGIRRLMYY